MTRIESVAAKRGPGRSRPVRGEADDDMGQHDEAGAGMEARSGSEAAERPAEARRVPDEVFPAAFLAWTDEESGEELQIALYGPADLVDSLLDAGFVRRLATSADGAAPAVRIRATPCP